jgi:hypothetical protein
VGFKKQLAIEAVEKAGVVRIQFAALQGIEN